MLRCARPQDQSPVLRYADCCVLKGGSSLAIQIGCHSLASQSLSVAQRQATCEGPVVCLNNRSCALFYNQAVSLGRLLRIVADHGLGGTRLGPHH